MPRYLIGIDLGTTNCAVAFTEARPQEVPALRVFPVPQLVAPSEMGTRPLLPSFVYLPGEHDLPPGSWELPWDARIDHVVGTFARDHGSKVPGRLVSSAKSWLCHAKVDRTAALLPWTAPPEVQKISAVEASARFLKHLAAAWNHAKAADHPDARFEDQDIVLTVPASFDDVARTLTAEAAQQAGFTRLTLLEEPQAAFYAWLGHLEKTTHAIEGLRPGMTCVVVDVGGGTSDFSLIQAVEEEGRFAFQRLAVGDHLLLGGDNMDLTLAKRVEQKFPEVGKLDAGRYMALIQACRGAKETLLAEQAPTETTVAVVGRGRAVVAETLFAPLTAAETKQILFHGFFPHVPFDVEPNRTARVGLHEMGLPYVPDPAITKHLAAFLREHGFGPERPPDAILFNGGVFQPVSLREHLIGVMRRWYERPDRPWNPVVLTTPSLDLAVALGAAYYGFLRYTGGQRIRGGLARSYYIRVGATVNPGRDSSQEPTTPPPAEPGSQLLCVVPRTLEEGQEIKLDRPVLQLALGQPVQFPLYTSTVRGQDLAGELVHVEPKALQKLAPLQTVLRGGKRSGTKTVPVTLAVQLTAIGTLELNLVAQDGPNRWRLEFNTRAIVEDDVEETAGAAVKSVETVTEVWPEEKIQAALGVLRNAFTGADEQAIKDLPKSLETALEARRAAWPTGLCRRLAEFLTDLADERRRSPAHLARWYNLVGFCLRPGVGAPKDRFRVERIWKILQAPSPGPGKPGSGGAIVQRAEGGGAEYWILWRRVSAGLSGSLQSALMDRLRSILIPRGGKSGMVYKPPPNELAEMWRAAASFERIDLKLKEQLGATLLKSLRRPPVPPYTFWALSRLGGRVLFHGPMNQILHPEIVGPWLTQLLDYAPTAAERPGWLICLANLVRRTDQRVLDLSDELRGRVADTLRRHGAAQRWIQLVEHGGELDAADQQQLLGDELPLGLQILAE